MSPNNVTDVVQCSDEHGVRTITLNRPDRRNAMDVAMRTQIASLAAEGHANPDVRAMVLTGADTTFCSGADIKGMQQYPDLAAARARVEAAQTVTRTIAGGPTPMVAAVEGHAIGAGLGLALACDHIVAASDAKLSASFIAIGLAADFGVLFTLTQRVGASRARTMLMLGDTVDAEEALGMGLVDELTAPGDARTRAVDVARQLAAGPSIALASLKRAFTGLPSSLAEALDYEVGLQAPLLRSADHQEAIAAFKQKRSPRFAGTYGSASTRC